jgi:hypothetical protein
MAVAPDSLLQNRLTICAMLNPGFIRRERASGTLFLLSYAALEPIREVWIHDEAFAASRLSMMRIMARRTKAATVIA